MTQLKLTSLHELGTARLPVSAPSNKNYLNKWTNSRSFLCFNSIRQIETKLMSQSPMKTVCLRVLEILWSSWSSKTFCLKNFKNWQSRRSLTYDLANSFAPKQKTKMLPAKYFTVGDVPSIFGKFCILKPLTFICGSTLTQLATLIPFQTF